jgi:hypothetical protein
MLPRTAIIEPISADLRLSVIKFRRRRYAENINQRTTVVVSLGSQVHQTPHTG